ncbi:hypothetical protein AN161_01620 [Lysinibacillus sp. FJAT-14222]|nr:hypothetical protein AN161_01620 [Lysinibacillus sp. FJAT-14222]
MKVISVPAVGGVEPLPLNYIFTQINIVVVVASLEGVTKTDFKKEDKQYILNSFTGIMSIL